MISLIEALSFLSERRSGEQERTHFIPVDPRNTTRECVVCGVKTDTQLWGLLLSIVWVHCRSGLECGRQIISDG